MEKSLQILNEIKRVDAPANLLDKIESEIQTHKPIPLYWIKAVAAIFICLISIEIYLAFDNQDEFIEFSDLIPETSNYLYDE